MKNNSIGFIGGGRVAKILLNGWKRAGQLPDTIVVTDTNPDALNQLKNKFPQIITTVNNSQLSAGCDIVFIGLHPPAVGEVLREIKSVLKPATIIVSLAPKISIAIISDELGGFNNIARVNPNAPSIVNAGYNPITFSTRICDAGRTAVLDLFRPLGDCPEIPEEQLEAFAITTAMGPTYFWFQMSELQELALSFGISSHTLKRAIPKMLAGAVETMYESGLTPAEVMDLVPVKPLQDDEVAIKELYRKKLNALYTKLKN